MDASSILSLFQNWLNKPFDPEGNAVNWILFLGFVLIIAAGWNKVIRSIVSD